jgi:hypothetical protein
METTDPLRNVLFAEDGENAYAIVDGAACRALLQTLDEFQPENFCLYEGELAPDVESCAPHLVALIPNHPFTEWLLAELPGKPWGILVRSPGTLLEMRKHFRSFLIVKNEQGQNLYFRYYDPRVLRTFLPTCDTEQLTKFFGTVSAFISEGEQGFTAYRFQDKQLRPRRIAAGDSSVARAVQE